MADAGTGSLMLVEALGSYTVELFQADGLRPRGIAMRDDVDGRPGSIDGSLASGASCSHSGAAHQWILLATLVAGWLSRLRP